MEPLVSAGWLAGHPDAVVVADVRWYLDGRSRGEAHEAGHVPGAVFVAGAMGRLGIEGAEEVIVYGGSGVTACSDLLAIEIAGLPPARLYPGSWSQWAADGRRRVETGVAE